MTFSEKLVRLRKNAGLTQEEFAASVGVSRQSVYKWETGISYPEVGALLNIKKLFGISIDNLLDDSYEIEELVKGRKRLKKKAEAAKADTPSHVTEKSPEEEMGGALAESESVKEDDAAERTSFKEEKKEENEEDVFLEGQGNGADEPEEEISARELTVYQKINIAAVKNLPSPNWYLCNNRFLLHGYFNYGYLILKTETEDDVEKAYLGVPGVYEKPEVVMVTLFGFEEFQMLPPEISKAQPEETISVQNNPQSFKAVKTVAQNGKEPKTGSFGCWMIPVFD